MHRARVLVAATCILLLFAGTAQGYDIGVGRWNPPTAKYSNSDVYPMSAAWMTVAASAAAAWTNVSSCPFSIVRDEIYGDVFLSTLGAYNRGADSGRLAATTYRATNGNIYRGTTWVNTYYPWATNGSSSAYDLQSCLTHEFGHWAPLKDVSSPTDATMYGTMPKGETKKRTLATDDINGIRAAYP